VTFSSPLCPLWLNKILSGNMINIVYGLNLLVPRTRNL
jgi:hypothetical protein